MSRAAGLAVLLLALALSGAAGGAVDPWAPLYRPLHLPTLAPEAPCPVSKIARLNFAKYGAGTGIGPGPAYPVGGITQPGSVVRFRYPPDPYSLFAGSEWSGQKVPWFAAPSYRGRVLIRGGRLDSPDTLRFNTGRVPPDELRIQSARAAVARQDLSRSGNAGDPHSPASAHPAATPTKSTAPPSAA